MKISSKLIKLIKESSSFLIVGHLHPEGDSLGSSLALALGLKKLGKKNVSVLSIDPVPDNLKFLPSAGIVKHKLPHRKHDVVILVDCNSPCRTGFSLFKADSTAIIDHHLLSAEDKGSDFHRNLSASYIDTSAAAAGILIYKVLKALKVEIDKNIATNLYTSLLVDTGGFKYSNVSPEPLKIASELVEAGAKPWEISKSLYENVSYESMQLLGLSLATIEKKDGVAWITTKKTMLDKTGRSSQDTEDFVNFPRKLRATEVAVFFREDEKNKFKVSLRSKGKVNVQKVAKTFGGGGHAAASGCKVSGRLKDVQQKVFEVIRKEMKNGK